MELLLFGVDSSGPITFSGTGTARISLGEDKGFGVPSWLLTDIDLNLSSPAPVPEPATLLLLGGGLGGRRHPYAPEEEASVTWRPAPGARIPKADDIFVGGRHGRAGARCGNGANHGRFFVRLAARTLHDAPLTPPEGSRTQDRGTGGPSSRRLREVAALAPPEASLPPAARSAAPASYSRRAHLGISPRTDKRFK